MSHPMQPHDEPPPEVQDAARRRSEARAARDFETADRLRAEIEAAGWRVVDRGTRHRLEPASPPSIEIEGEVRYGRSADVPSRLDEPPSGAASLIVAAGADAADVDRCLASIEAHRPSGVDVVVVEDGNALELDVDARPVPELERIRTSEPIGAGAALNIGVRRARAPIVVLVAPTTVLTADAITPLIGALADPSVAVAGLPGLTTIDMQRFDRVGPADLAGSQVDVAAIGGSVLAFRRADAAATGPADEAFRTSAFLAIWWSLVLRDSGADAPPRRAVALPGLPSVDAAADAGASAAVAGGDRDRVARRDFYRLLDRFRTRLDLVVPPVGE